MSAPCASYLCSLLSLIEQPERNETHSSNSGLLSLVKRTVTSKSSQHARRGAGLPLVWGHGSCSWALRDAEMLYTHNLLKKCILTKFQVFCVTTIEPADLCGEIAQAANVFNTQAAAVLAQNHHSTPDRWTTSRQHNQLSFADFVEILVSCRSELIVDKILRGCSKPDDVLSVAKHEALIIESLVSTFNTHSTLLHESVENEVHVLTQETRSVSFSCSKFQPLERSSSSVSSDTPSKQLDKGVLREIELLVASELWKQVALCLRHRVGSMDRFKDFALSAALILSEEQGFAAASKCLQYVAITLAMEEELMEWDKGFQSMLAASQKPTPNKKPCKPVEIFCSSVLPPLQNVIAATKPARQPHQLTTAASIAAHLDHLMNCHHFSTPLLMSVNTISNTLVSSLQPSLANWNLTMLARYIFAEAPRVSHSVYSIDSEIRKLLPSTAFFPTFCGGYLTEKRLQTSYSSFQKTFSQMHDRFDSACVCFHDFLKDRYRQCLCSVFPSDKQWRIIGKRGSAHTCDQPSKYCDVMVEQLIIPITEAAGQLGEQAQRVYMDLAVSILFNEYRRVITQNKYTYRLPAGRQLLVDFHHLSQWLSSDRLGLLPATLQSLSSLPVVAEVEQGLQLLCGTAAFEPDTAPHRDGSIADSHHAACVRGYSSLSVWSEIAWHSSSDWQQCML